MAQFGYVVEVKGPVVDVAFDEGNLPLINDCLTITVPKEENNGFTFFFSFSLHLAFHY